MAAGVLPVSDGLEPALCGACSKAEGQRINGLRALKPPSRSATRLGPPPDRPPRIKPTCAGGFGRRYGCRWAWTRVAGEEVDGMGLSAA